MAFIKPQLKITEEPLSVKVDVEVLSDLRLYAQCSGSSTAYIVTEILRKAFRKDRDFIEWKKNAGSNHNDATGKGE